MSALGVFSAGSLPALGARAPTPAAPRRLIVDSDTANEIDDLFAISRVLMEPGLRVEGITSAQWHTQGDAPRDTVGPSQRLNETILRLMDRGDVPHPIGSNTPLVRPHRPQPSDAARHIISTARETPEGEKLSVAVLGPCTNLASAILMEPSIVPKISCYFIGLRYDHEQRLWGRDEFNTNNDPNALDLLLNTPGLEFHLMTATTSGALTFEKTVADRHLKGEGGIADYLVQYWEDFEREWQQRVNPTKETWTMWDIALIEALLRPDLARAVSTSTPPNNRDRSISVWVEIDTAGMKADYWRAFDRYLAERP
jgi:inosine-uridine nucleoside N-ribohydrolase